MPGNTSRPRVRFRNPAAKGKPDATLPRPLLRAVVAEPAEEDPAMGFDRRAITVVGLMAALAIATVGAITVALVGDESDPPASPSAVGALASARALPTSAPSSASLPADPSPSPTGDVASSQSLTQRFDVVPTGATIDGWTLIGDGALEAVAVPTAVDRSARLDARFRAMACSRLDVALGTLAAAFMVDAVPGGGLPLLTLGLDDGTTLALTLTDSGAVLADSGAPVALEPDTWYRWVVTGEGDAVGVQLLSADDTPLAEATPPAGGAGATEFCMTVEAPTRVFLNELVVEAR